MNPKCSFGSIGNPAIRPIEFSFCFDLDRCALPRQIQQVQTKPFGKSPGQLSKRVEPSSDRSAIISPFFASELVDFYIFSFIKLEGTCFRVDICAEFSDRLKPWPEIRGEVIRVFFLYFCTGHNAFYTFI